MFWTYHITEVMRYAEKCIKKNHKYGLYRSLKRNKRSSGSFYTRTKQKFLNERKTPK